MKKYEYRVIWKGSHEISEVKVQDYLNSLGEQGWDLVQIIEKPFMDGHAGVASRDFVVKREIQIET